jgi:hypothetical protein
MVSISGWREKESVLRAGSLSTLKRWAERPSTTTEAAKNAAVVCQTIGVAIDGDEHDDTM